MQFWGCADKLLSGNLAHAFYVLIVILLVSKQAEQQSTTSGQYILRGPEGGKAMLWVIIASSP